MGGEGATGTRRARTGAALAGYLALSALWVGLIELAKRSGARGAGGWLLQHALPAAVVLAAAWLVAGVVAPGERGALMRLGRPPARLLAVAAVGALPALAVVGWHGVHQPKLLSAAAVALTVKLAINQGLVEEGLARGLLLGWLLRTRGSARRALWLSAVSFGVMHLLQLGLPPYNVERLVSGLVLVVLTTPIGAVLAWLTLTARSVWPAVLLHLLTDLTIVPQKLGRPSHPLILLGALGSAALVALLLVREQRADRPH